MDEENEKDDIDRYIESIVTKKISEPEGFEKAIREKKCDWQIKSIVSRKNRALSVENEEKGKYYEKND